MKLLERDFAAQTKGLLMEASPSRPHFLIVHRDVLIAQDLSEMLSTLDLGAIDQHRNITQPFSARYDVAFVAMPMREAQISEELAALQRQGTAIVLLNVDIAPETTQLNGFYVLGWPFSFEAIQALMTRLEIVQRPAG